MPPVETLLRAVANGDEGSFTTLYQSTRGDHIRYATGLLAGDRSAAEDVVDEAMFAVWEQAGRYSGEGSAQGWLRRIVRNKAVDWVRKHSREVGMSEPNEQFLLSQADPAPGPHEIAEEASAAARLREALSGLSVEHREAVWLCYFEELSLAEIAVIAGCPENTVKTRLFHARTKLKGSYQIH